MEDFLSLDSEVLIFIALFWGAMLAVIIRSIFVVFNEPFFSGRDWPDNNNIHNNEDDL